MHMDVYNLKKLHYPSIFKAQKKGGIGDLWEQPPKLIGSEVGDIRTRRRNRIWARTLVQVWDSKNMNRSEKISWREQHSEGKQEKSRGKNGAKPSRCAANETHENFWDRINGSELGCPVRKVIEKGCRK